MQIILGTQGFILYTTHKEKNRINVLSPNSYITCMSQNHKKTFLSPEKRSTFIMSSIGDYKIPEQLKVIPSRLLNSP